MVTSIAPKRLEAQQEAISSWQNYGFQVVSFNHPSEIEKIESSFDGVAFVEAKITANDLYDFDIPYVSLREILAFVFSHKQPCWIANSDIILKTSKQKISYIQKIAKTTLVFGHRIDISGENFNKGRLYEGGFDYFALSNQIDHLFTSRTHLCIGQPWWDFWLPITCSRKGIVPIRCRKKLAYHRKHKTMWNIDQHYFFGKLFARELGIPEFNRSELGRFSEMIWKHITEKSDTLTVIKKNARKKA